MNKLKLIKPWLLPTVRMTLCDTSLSMVAVRGQAPSAAPCSAPMRDEDRSTPMFRAAANTAPACSVIFASTANQQLGCPRQSI